MDAKSFPEATGQAEFQHIWTNNFLVLPVKQKPLGGACPSSITTSNSLSPGILRQQPQDARSALNTWWQPPRGNLSSQMLPGDLSMFAPLILELHSPMRKEDACLRV